MLQKELPQVGIFCFFRAICSKIRASMALFLLSYSYKKSALNR